MKLHIVDHAEQKGGRFGVLGDDIGCSSQRFLLSTYKPGRMTSRGSSSRRNAQKQVRNAQNSFDQGIKQLLFLVIKRGNILQLREGNVPNIVYRHPFQRF